ncbi:holin family protein [Palleronia abyssalis]|uniref:Carboxylesterase n=1 Tax=Palleronia abyssalis TaxID=1501240 RepID=A0A2R8BQC2_9RHOB|nr:holin family protein [Palleronia abyssalis]SPJ22374.1 hypothetical protein PAA8504_00166 [Palleronia abyssalis]
MGLIDRGMGVLFGSGGKVLTETAELFRENAENRAVRDVEMRSEALGQFAAEFQHADKGGFDRFMDGLNRVPRPAMALGTMGLFGAAMVDPVWFGARMDGLATVPDPLWWLLGAIVSFYFGARHQAKGQEFRRSVIAAARMLPPVVQTPDTPQVEPEGDRVERTRGEDEGLAGPNAALDAWRAG